MNLPLPEPPPCLSGDCHLAAVTEQVVSISGNVENIVEMDGVSLAIECRVDVDITSSFGVGSQASNASDRGVLDGFISFEYVVAIHNM
jgi:hypothetical protein